MEKIKCLVTDDEFLAQELLKNYINKIEHLSLIKTCDNAVQTIAALQSEEIDVLFLDIQMPDLTGLMLLRSLKKVPLTIFTTAYAQYALEGYQLNVVDYLLKPFTFERFLQAVNKATDMIQKERKFQALQQTISTTSVSPTSTTTSIETHFFVKANYKLIKVKFEEILYIEGMREYIRIFLKNKKPIITHQTMKYTEKVLPNYFFRIHKSFLINTILVESVEGNMIEIQGTKLPVSKNYKKAFFEILGADLKK